MIQSLRSWYNHSFTQEKYKAYKDRITELCGEEPLFRMSETPLFAHKDFKRKILRACDDLIDTITDKDFIESSEKSILSHLRFPGDPFYSPVVIFDFGVCQDENGDIEPQLIEMQGFPSLFCFQVLQEKACREIFDIPDHMDTYLNCTSDEHIQDLKKIILGDTDPTEVILLDHEPDHQKTKVDFAATKKLLGIDAVCVTKLKQEDKNLYYVKDGKQQRISRIYNRLIFEEFYEKNIPHVDLRQDLNITWVPHPNWFCRISKYLLPFVKSDFVPKTTFVSDLRVIPDDLSKYVLKPLYSYAGMGVKIDVHKEDIISIPDPENWILQKKVEYIPAIETPSGNSKAEIRMMAIWDSPTSRPRVVHNLARMSKGKMIGVRYNADFDWVGSSLCYFEK